MADVVGFAALSHSPFLQLTPPTAEGDPGYHFVDTLAELRRRVRGADVDAVVLFGPDHFRGAFYDCLAPFTIGAESVQAWGDYGSLAGQLPVATALARDIHQGVLGAGFDPALSLNLHVDHGIAQAYDMLYPEGGPPCVPVLVNCGAPPLNQPRRAWDFGRAVGAAIRASHTPGNVLVVGSGGLSHWPPAASPDSLERGNQMRDYLINGRNHVAEMEPQRTAAVLALGRSTDARVNESWDRRFLELLHTTGGIAEICELSTTAIEDAAGNGGQEVRNWMAALGAWGQPVTWTDYEAVPPWITGMGVATTL
ncbi:2,3-dihydroxyphenylpropionate 1,2-dioxygenase [Williamsia limnetica]|uniref:2,3-dihydroxyphenylpropionate 1,2-dioxygenase n=1 Tax=Williamsia limnetica TaxID=882452 RepID=A0A318RB89_WILLI|nr:2,3-dihydroxyphenylpropionate 1,2-dioxygenase [Williamsia limnetica]PYE11841.1 2,3-dihydroxyphenylpropionate 1,2-dioxygenase [Williamsia limnetica]